MDCKVIQDYVITPVVLGKGCFGTVYRGYLKKNRNKLLAVKAIELKSIKNEENIRREIDIQVKLNNPNIVKFYAPVKTKNNLYFFLEYCQQDLKSHVATNGGKLSQLEVRGILKQICNGFKDVHKRNIIHRDIKPANFLIHDGIVKIADFGFAKVVDNVNESSIQTFLGSPLYMAPQVLAKQQFSSKCDVWSLGVTIYQILYGRAPFTARSPKQLLERILKQKLTFPDSPKRSDQIKDLLRRMLQIREEDRISWNQLFEHPVICPPQVFIQTSTDSLMQSFKQSQAYMGKNKVASKTLSNAIQSDQQKKEQLEPTKQDFREDVNEQQQKIKQYIKVQQIDDYMRYKRNVSVFLNVQCNAFFSEVSQQIPDQFFYMGLFILLRRQLQIHKSLKHQLSSGKPTQKIPQHIWVQYLKSGPHSRLTRLVQCDIKHLLAYFKEVRSRMMKSLQKCQINETLGIFQKYFINDEQNFSEQAYEKIIDFLTCLLKQSGLKYQNLIIKLKITKSPFKYLRKSLDFGLFYEREAQQLQNILKKHPQLQ